MPTKFQSAVAKMPPLRHSFPDRPFNVAESPALRWALEQPVIMSWVWDHIRNSGACAFNAETGEWRGVEPAVPVVGRPSLLACADVLAVMPATEDRALSFAAIWRLVNENKSASRSSVRSKITALRADGLVVMKPGDGLGCLYYAKPTPTTERETVT